MLFIIWQEEESDTLHDVCERERGGKAKRNRYKDIRERCTDYREERQGKEKEIRRRGVQA